MLYNVIEKEVFIASKNYFINGITELLILSILNCHDSYVYEIVKSIENFSEGLLTISQNTIYTATYKLENEGKITEYSKQVGKKRTRIYYRIEQSGREFLKEISQNYKNTTDGIQKIMNVLSQEQGGCKTDE
jgi:predicted transcriptional regulators